VFSFACKYDYLSQNVALNGAARRTLILLRLFYEFSLDFISFSATSGITWSSLATISGACND